MNIKNLLLLTFLCLPFLQCFAQTGFFSILEEQKHCSNLAIAIDTNEKYCLAPKPIIDQSEFKLITNIGYNPAKTYKYFEIKLSDNAFASLQLLNTTFANKWVFVVDGHVIGSFQGEKIFSKIITISGSVNSKEFDAAFEELKKNKTH